MKLAVNGTAETVADGLTVKGLLDAHGLSPSATVVERNGQILARETYADTVLAEDDVLELVQVVGGG